MNDSNLGIILKSMPIKRADKIKDLEHKKSYLYKQYPRLLEIEKTITSLGPQSVLASISKDFKKAKDLQNKIKELGRERQSIIKEANIDFDYFSPDWDCKNCEDSGYIDGKLCPCISKQLINLRYKNSNISALLDYQNFQNFDLSLYSDFEQGDKSPKYYANLNYKFALAFCENFSKSYENIFISGKPGTGKTFLCSAIAKCVIDRGFSVIYMTSYNLIKEYKDIQFDKVDKKISDYIDCDLLIIDDLGSENRSDYSKSVLFQIINDRINQKKSTVISSNLSIAEIQTHYSGRIASRIGSADFAKLRFTGKDLRL